MDKDASIELHALDWHNKTKVCFLRLDAIVSIEPYLDEPYETAYRVNLTDDYYIVDEEEYKYVLKMIESTFKIYNRNV